MQSEQFEWKKVFEDDLPHLVKELKDLLPNPSAVILTGELGSGKTTLLKSLFPELDLYSPSYSLVNEYGNTVHADLYRLKNKDEFSHLELNLYLENKEYFFIEWGKDYKSLIEKELDNEWSLFEMEILFNESDEKNGSRNYTLTYHTRS